MKADGAAVSAGGHGMLIDDAGGGFWIGREGLKQTLRLHDERGRPSDLPLAQEVYGALGSTRWLEINQTVHEDGRGRIASLPPWGARLCGATLRQPKSLCVQAVNSPGWRRPFSDS